MNPAEYNAVKARLSADDAEQDAAASMSCRNLNTSQQSTGRAVLMLARAVKHLAAAVEFQEKRYQANQEEREP